MEPKSAVREREHIDSQNATNASHPKVEELSQIIAELYEHLGISLNAAALPVPPAASRTLSVSPWAVPGGSPTWY